MTGAVPVQPRRQQPAGSDDRAVEAESAGVTEAGEATEPGRDRHWLRGLLLLALVAAGVAVGWWAARATLVPAPSPAGGSQVTTVTAEVAPAAVGRTIPLSVTVRQPVEVAAVNLLPGVVTRVERLAEPVDAGDVLYAVAGVPVRAVAGQVPFYRDLAHGAEGADVTQLQQALAALGYFSGSPDGRYQVSTAAAVRKWQEDLAMPVTGTVALGELVALPSLPAAVMLGEQIRSGALLSGGEDGVRTASGRQDFELVVSEDQNRLIPADAVVRVTWGDQTWDAAIADIRIDGTGNSILTLQAPDGGPVCREACSSLPNDPQLTLRSEVVVVPEVAGLGVPAAAVRTRDDGTTYVLRADGSEQNVHVRAAGRGVVILDGLQAGNRVQVLSADPSTSTTPPGETPGG